MKWLEPSNHPTPPGINKHKRDLIKYADKVPSVRKPTFISETTETGDTEDEDVQEDDFGEASGSTEQLFHLFLNI